MTTALIAEDEPHIRTQLKALLAELWPTLHIVSEVEDGIQALAAMREHAPDIAFLDMKMPGLSGLEVVQALGAGSTLIVFVTAFDQFAAPAFAEDAVDYVVKPITIPRLAKTVSRLQARLAGATSGPVPPQSDFDVSEIANHAVESDKPLRWIQASQGDKVIFITVDEVLYFQADSKYTRVVTARREAFIRRPIKALMQALDPRVFLQIHRGTLVNINYIDLVERDGLRGMSLVLRDHPTSLQVAQTYQAKFRGM